ncbi:hypothetical protein THRCLA_23015 [Thraustotheca clavata]|uniref:Uncharacterized protein n=1 Tax=Thraustotheca clavata TaxID=74557 RepID=A0A1V9YIS0_9STRA|nr:hypothetical protein THRCLA_23015 [Thraustotheca clavata]
MEDNSKQPSEARLRRRQQDREAKRSARSAYIEESNQLKETIRALTNNLGITTQQRS